ncbi:uncharacterized protein LOC117177463 isoform X2 [Belonocnema kinseyi]|uniref:uncharacterized protein LOC117177463 isoform X2 n=1 Tax=Belonocnema kinseyi TaxID=2817044 RepID=UPI00143D6B24|nr:uncharacterized protein LOC117177463 isoform X2 [Belonocnema kinseyi]
MAGGNDHIKQGGSFDKTNVWQQYHRYRDPCFIFEPPTSEGFRRRQRKECNSLVLRSIDTLQEDIFRIFSESIYCDLNILIGYKVIRTNQCILRTRSPFFLKIIEPYFDYSDERTSCYLNTPGIFHQIERFVRDYDTYQECNLLLRKNERDDSIDVISTPSDMADSGLETGSMSPHETTASDNSVTEFEESQGAEYTSMDEDFSKLTSDEGNERSPGVVHFERCRYKSKTKNNEADTVKPEYLNLDATCSSSEPEHHQCEFSAFSEENVQKLVECTEEIFQYENQVLNDPFYESDDDDNNQDNSPMPSDSFEFVDPENLSCVNYNSEEKPENYKEFESEESERLRSGEKEKKSPLENFHSELSGANESIKSSTTSVNSYFFIDASSLNDDVVPLVGCSQERGESLPPYFCPSDNYVPSRTADSKEEEKFMNVKATNSQSRQEYLMEFRQELKLNELLKPRSVERKIKRGDLALEDKFDGGTVKEALVVEIKEADSGESTQPSPCPDNTKIVVDGAPISNEEVVPKSEGGNETTGESQNTEDNPCDDRRPSLIRRNTFELDSNDEKLSALRQEYERRQGSLVFQNSIPQYSGHRVDDDSCYGPPLQPSLVIGNPIPDPLSKIIPQTSCEVFQKPCVSLNKLEHDSIQRETKCNYFFSRGYEESEIASPMQRSVSDKNVADSQEDISENCNSLPVTLNSILANNRESLVRRQARDEAIPIVSGGASSSDFTKPTDSPIVRRKTESTPIVSGGSVLIPEPEPERAKPKMSSSMTAWIVDMSTSYKTTKSNSQIMSQSFSSNSHGMSHSYSTSDCLKKPTKKTKHEKQGSFGFFVDLSDVKTAKEKEVQESQKKQNGAEKYCEFFIDMSDNDASLKAKKEVKVPCVKTNSIDSNDKKNIFSMFIDFKEPRKSRDSLPGLSLTKRKSTEREAEKSSTDETSITTEEDERQEGTSACESTVESIESTIESNQETPVKEKNKGVFMFIQSDSPVVKRRTLSSSRVPFKRYSWNTDKTNQDGSENGTGTGTGNGTGNSGNSSVTSNGTGSRNGTLKHPFFRKEHKRAQSLSIDRGDLRKFQGRSSNSSHSLSEAARADPINGRSSMVEEENGKNMDTSTEEVFEYDIRDTPPNSHIEIINEEVRMSVKHNEFQETKSTEVATVSVQEKNLEDEGSEAWDKTGTESTEGQTRKSETFDISSGSGPSPGSENRDFELAELLSGQVSTFVDRAAPIIAPTGAKIFETHKSLNEKIKRIECELKSPEFDLKQKEDSKGLGGDFVRLSDLDSTSNCPTSNVTVIKETEAFTHHRMCNSIPETSWIESKLVITRTNGPMRTRPRQFSSHMSTSLPPKQKSPMEDLTGERDVEGIISESDLSSMQSSMGRSGAEGSTEETETSSFAGTKPYNRLGEDLLRMFLEEINPDVTIDVAGRKIRAHKCILSSRCQYFAAILSGGWVESTGNIISLQGYSYNAVHFALCHIYSGESNIPDTISIMELATLADMLCLEGLKEVIGYTLKVKYCHLFHKPCQVCAVGVLECMPLAAAYGLDELYRKSLKWVTRHFVRIWPCKAFATLPRELMDKCYHQHIVHMSTENVLQTIMDCDKLLATLPNVRWAEPVFRLVSDLLDTSVKFLSDSFAGVLGSESFQGLGRDLTWNISRLEDNFLLAAERLPPEQACKSYAKLHKMLAATQLADSPLKAKWGPLFIDFIQRIQNRVEKCLIREAARASRTTTWLKMDLELRRRIQELACLVILPIDTSKRQSRHSNFLKDPKMPSGRLSTNRSLDIKRVKTAITEYNGKSVKSTTTTTTQQTKRVVSKPKTDPLERKMQEEKPTTDSALRPKSWPNKAEVKSRYLEPRNKSVTKGPAVLGSQEKVTTQRRKIMISSSDSSRTSSPAMKRTVEKKPVAKLKLQVKKDSKALSSDSLTDSNATRISNKKDIISKSCGITRPESPSYKQKDVEVGLSVDSLADPKKKPPVKKVNKMDTSMSTDSLMTEVMGTPKSTISNKFSPNLARGLTKSQVYDRTKKCSPQTQPKNAALPRRPRGSLESSTAASRNRAAAANPYHGSPNLRRNLLEAAKTPDISAKPFSNVAPRTITRHTAQSATAAFNAKRDKKETLSSSIDSPGKRTSPKLSASQKLSKSAIAIKTKAGKGIEDKSKPKTEAPKLLTVGSRSGTFLKDEPTILKKADIKSSEIDT